MRFTTSALLALPLLAAAAESPFQEYKAKFQNFLGNFVAAPEAAKQDPVAASSTKSSKAKVVGAKKIETLSLNTWKDTLYAPVKPDATRPEEWYVLITGGNKTCFGHCAKVEAAFNESVAKFATLSKSPHVAMINCDDEKILCNSWSATTGALWIFEMLPAPAAIDVYWKRLNLTTTTSQTILDLYVNDDKKAFYLIDSYFHPFDGVLAKNDLAVPVAYLLWGFNAIPSWAMMLFVSFFSRSMM
ncbi:hypothetical protein B0T26DRAFT_789311 [Lasiosphaeria miniovina]|uniref:Peptidyl-tRNA hydrolase n=1 Tax=Lasiosphaeria miniovina TaxID=1954250 RepID=A0AA40DML2_9PEZI|nr:uncharacterized protein B0T26DRAFT_789311 [Lasiosphaeria miniovina]KAK0706372.1 hypothetical protein B0T26DRAFT_789311 [Lasiosphaeria miniovina]